MKFNVMDENNRMSDSIGSEQLSFKNSKGSEIDSRTSEDFDRNRWHKVVYVDDENLEDLVVESKDKNVRVKPFYFDRKNISKFIQKIEQYRDEKPDSE